MEHLEEQGVRLSFERSGWAGDPVALIHGGWEDAGAWDLVVPGLATAFQVLVYDRRGHGGSSGPGRQHPVREDAADLARLLESTGLFPAHLVSQGYGGAVALRLAVDRPELVRSVACHEVSFVGLLSDRTGSSAGGPSVTQRIQRVSQLALHDAPEVATRAYLELFASAEEQWPALDERWGRSLLVGARSWAEEMSDPESAGPRVEELPGVAVPVLATAGTNSPPFASAIQERLVAELPNATALPLREVGHFVHRTDPDLLVGVLGTFLLERNVPTT